MTAQPERWQTTDDQWAFATLAGIDRNLRPASIGKGGRLQSECPAGVSGIRTQGLPEAGATCHT
ncbi:MAG: hypothetical protein OJF58_001686 [Enhydrobacter sp.]|nr:MAG: hypothetical protein OJF58_001686 [Enhydrobacter sp.]